MTVSAKQSDKDMHSLPLTERLKHFNGMLVLIMLYAAFCAFNYGYDVGNFSGVQAMQSFEDNFGAYNEEEGQWALPGWLSSVMTATPFLGKALGCICCGWIAERWGRKMAFLVMCLVSFVGVLLQVTSFQSAAQFTVGRVVTYGMTGMAIVLIPIYAAETAPKCLRGMFASTTQVMIAFGSVVSSLVTFGTQHIQTDAGWRIPIGLQFVAPAFIFSLLPFIPESPRWLLSRGRRADAVKNLKKLRNQATDDEIQFEIEAISYAHGNEQKGPWKEVFNKQNRVRTGVAALAMWGQQITGQAFPSQYGVLFYQSQGFASRAFVFNLASNILSFGAVLITWISVDGVGRRPALLVGGSFMALWLFILGAIGSLNQQTLSTGEKNMQVASILLFSFFYNLSWAPVSFAVLSETAALRVKEKTNMLACVVSVLTTFATSFTVPYLINADYANLGGRVGYIYGSLNVMMVVLTFFFIPEMKGRSLEEVDQLFESKVPLRKFGAVKTKTAQEIYQDGVEEKVAVATNNQIKEEAFREFRT